MPGICRLGDKCTGHDDFPPRPNISASDSVFINGKGVHRIGDSWAVHCNPSPSCHSSVTISGSSSIRVNGQAVARTGDSVACGSKIAAGSTNVFAGD